MSSLLATFQSAGSALQQFEKAVAVCENNTVNASTPGYAAESVHFQALAFNPDAGLYGGVQTGAVESARNEYAESAVWRQASQQSLYSQLSTSLTTIDNTFDVSGTSGISTELQSFFNACGSWANSPADSTLRAAVVTAAQDVATSFQQTSSQLQAAAQDTTTQAQSVVSQINSIASTLATLNKQVRLGGDTQTSAETEVYAQLEDLSSLTDFTVVQSSDDSFTVLLGGQVPLVVGDKSYQITASSKASTTTGAPPSLEIIDSSNTDVTSMVHAGKLAADIQTVNGTIGKLLGNDSGIGSLNQLASSFATRVNQILASGVVDNTVTPTVSGAPLFSVTTDGNAASGLSVTEGFTGAELAAINPGSPSVANGIATQLSNLDASTDSADQVGGATYINYYGTLVSEVGDAEASATTSNTQYTQLATQARSLRSDLSGVSLDTEATMLVQFQRSYQAAAKTVSVVNSMMDTLMGMIQA